MGDPALLVIKRLEEIPMPAGPVAPILGRPAAARAERFAEPKNRETFVAARLALRSFAARLLAVNPSRLTPNYDCPRCGPGLDHGRPGFLLDGGPAPLALSASRAAGWVLLAGVVHPGEGLRLGVDLEAVAQARFAGFDEVALTAAERGLVSELPEGKRDAQRARLWARKEAWLKMTGDGLRMDPAEVNVLNCPGIQDVGAVGGRPLPGGLVAALALA
ncbi:4'-phosphopantetheinyl transferase superfamily protein [Paenarthrobacter sp. S56]|uniref:4'-phosphopantetheinyl transferase family protein n=1 Tax=Paenarthrobacter sp. S56 TaxID=3138179 RepID=UPI00321B2142